MTTKQTKESVSSYGSSGKHAPVALVTGGGTGLGLAISRQLAKEGFRLAVGYSRSEAQALAGAESLRLLGAEVSLHRANIAIGSETDALIDQVYDTHGSLDVVVNNAGITRFVPFPDIQAVDESVWDEIMDVNLKGTYLACRAAALRMRESGGGAIVNISSTAGVVPGGSSIPYAVSKAGILHLTKALSIALAPKIRVNAVAPNLMLTRWWESRENDAERYEKSMRFGRAHDVDDVAKAVVLLAMNQSISGQTLVVDLANMFL